MIVRAVTCAALCALLCGCGETVGKAVREPSVTTSRYRFTAHLLPKTGPWADPVAAAVTVTELATGHVREVPLPDGATSQRGIAASPDGRFVYTVHGMARYKLPATQMDHGWECSSAMSVFDGGTGAYLHTVTLDEVTLGAANPWSVAVTPDGTKILVTHAGTHELSVIDRLAFHNRLADRPDDPDLSADFTFLQDIRRRVRLGGDGPREFVRVTDTSCTVRLHFAHALATYDYASGKVTLKALPNPPAQTLEREGERLFNDATICFQHWQSCASCHPDGTADGFAWDFPFSVGGLGHPEVTPDLTRLRCYRPDRTRQGDFLILLHEASKEEGEATDAYVRSLASDAAVSRP